MEGEADLGEGGRAGGAHVQRVRDQRLCWKAGRRRSAASSLSLTRPNLAVRSQSCCPPLKGEPVHTRGSGSHVLAAQARVVHRAAPYLCLRCIAWQATSPRAMTVHDVKPARRAGRTWVKRAFSMIAR